MNDVCGPGQVIQLASQLGDPGVFAEGSSDAAELAGDRRPRVEAELDVVQPIAELRRQLHCLGDTIFGFFGAREANHVVASSCEFGQHDVKPSGIGTAERQWKRWCDEHGAHTFQVGWVTHHFRGPRR